MNSPRFVGQMLALCLPGLIALAPVVQSRTPQSGPRLVPTGSVSIWHREAGQYRQSLETPMVQQVQYLLDRVRTLEGPGLDTHQRARAVLSEHYGDRMAVTSAPMTHYVRVWDPQLGWVIVCISISTLEIDFGRRGTVVVETTDEMPVE